MKLFKLCSDGKSIQTWEIRATNDGSGYYTISGKIDGKSIISAPKIVNPKVNRTQDEQLLLEINSRISVQKRRKYVEDIADINVADAALPGYSAMLAKKFVDESHKIIWPCIAQPKLDGIRCLATADGFFTRGRKPIEACEHIREQLKPFFEQYPDSLLDGELYSHALKSDFEKIIAVVRKSAKKATHKDLELQKLIEYHVYDAPCIGDLDENEPFDLRFKQLTDAFEQLGKPKNVEFVNTVFNVPSEDELFDIHFDYTKMGYEGTMVRNAKMKYEGKRTHNLLKLKDTDDAEFMIVGINEGRGKLVGHAGAFVLVTDSGNEFKGKLEGSLERLGWIWKNPGEVLGKMATVKFQGLTTKNGVPRFPVVKSIRGFVDRSDWL